ncbi:MAG: DUF3368 domain-containing protein [Sulfuricella sp.]
MIVFSNTTPLIALAGINRLDLLHGVFGRIHLAQEVVDECAAGGKILVPELTKLPWVEIVQSTHPILPSLLLDLDMGELHTLDMAKKLRADRVIIDERIGRNLAEYIGLSVIGTLGVLLKAKQLGLIPSFSDAVSAMQENGIHYHPALVEKLIKHAGE